MTEQWRPIASCPGYEVSDLGRVRSWKGRGRGKRAEPVMLKSGAYDEVWLTIDGRQTSRRVHKLQSEAFGTPMRHRIDTILDEVKVADIRVRRARGEKAVVLAHEYGVVDSQISKIMNGRAWRHVAG